jgi:ABC-type branched-subunit amino acid transport system substrate-binding protein
MLLTTQDIQLDPVGHCARFKLGQRYKLLGCVGGYGSSVSVASSQILSRLNIIQIAYSSTAAILSDRIGHPYFMRTCTPDDKQARAMIKIIQKLRLGYLYCVSVRYHKQ